MKKISILVPCYNEEENVIPMSEAIIKLFENELDQYDYELVFIDNDSTDNTRMLLRKLCEGNKRIKAILNVRNFGQNNSPYYGLLQTTGMCTINIACDFQDPIELIPQYIREWEKGYKVVVGVKKSSKENIIMYKLRGLYYKTLKKFSEVELIEHFTGTGLYDRDFLEILRKLQDPSPFLRGIIAELGYKVKKIPYEQMKRRAGKTHNNFLSLYDIAMLSFTSYTKMGLRVATFIGVAVAFLSAIIGLVYLILKFVYWDRFMAGIMPVVIGIFFLWAVQLIFIGIMGEYILSINQRIMNRPLVVEEERINFENEEDKYYEDEK